MVHGGNCDSCRNWNDEAEVAITKTQRCSKTYWWKVKGLGFSALKDSYIRGPGEGCALLSSFPAAKSFPVLPAAARRSWERKAAYLSPINGRSVRPWNGAASFPVTETSMIFIFFFLETLNLNEGKWGENVPGFSVPKNLKEAPMCLSS